MYIYIYMCDMQYVYHNAIIKYNMYIYIYVLNYTYVPASNRYFKQYHVHYRLTELAMWL